MVSSTEQQASRGRSLNRRAPIVWDTGAGGVGTRFRLFANCWSVEENYDFFQGHYKYEPSKDASQRSCCCGKFSTTLEKLFISMSILLFRAEPTIGWLLKLIASTEELHNVWGAGMLQPKSGVAGTQQQIMFKVSRTYFLS